MTVRSAPSRGLQDVTARQASGKGTVTRRRYVAAMPRCYRMPNLERATYLAGLLEGAQIAARAELRSFEPLLVVACDRRDVDGAIRCIEPEAQLVLS